MLLLKNGSEHPMNGDRFVGDVLIRDGKIHAAAARLEAPEAEVLDVSGCHVIPGIIDAHCHRGMWEDGMGREGPDGNDVANPTTPELRSPAASSPRSRHMAGPSRTV